VTPSARPYAQTMRVLETTTMFLDCPAYLNHKGDVRCRLPAEVERRFTMGSSGGHAESAMIRCPAA
jgi:hypothetical protein